MDDALKAAAAVAANAPSVTELGHHLAAVRRAHHLFDCANLACKESRTSDHSAEMSLLFGRADAIREMIATQPAASLSDAAVAIAEALTIAARISGDGDAPPSIVCDMDRIERMLLAALPFVSDAAGLDARAMYWGENDNLRVARFRGVGVVS